MTYTKKELNEFLHGISLSLLSKKSAQYWRYDEETAKEIEWLEALERKVRADKADLKTEPITEDSSTVPTISKMEQVEDEPQAEEPRCSVNGTPYDECGFCEYFNCDTCRCEADVPQTERSE